MRNTFVSPDVKRSIVSERRRVLPSRRNLPVPKTVSHATGLDEPRQAIQSAIGRDVSHSYTGNGTYIATLTVTDGRGVTSTSQPITVTVAQAQELLQLAQQQALVLSVFHNRRWDTDIRSLREVLTIKRRLLELRRILAPMRDVANQLLRRDFDLVSPATLPYSPQHREEGA